MVIFKLSHSVRALLAAALLSVSCTARYATVEDVEPAVDATPSVDWYVIHAFDPPAFAAACEVEEILYTAAPVERSDPGAGQKGATEIPRPPQEPDVSPTPPPDAQAYFWETCPAPTEDWTIRCRGGEVIRVRRACEQGPVQIDYGTGWIDIATFRQGQSPYGDANLFTVTVSPGSIDMVVGDGTSLRLRSLDAHYELDWRTGRAQKHIVQY